MNKRKTVALFLIIGLTILSFFFYRQYQPAITYAKCSLCDGNQYLKMYDFVGGKTIEPEAKFPYYSRILVPALASIISMNDPYLGFQLVNLLFSLFAVIGLFYLWNKLEIPLYLIAIGFFWLLFHWTGLIRLNAFDPITVDLPTYLIQTLFLVILINRNYIWLLLLGPVAVLQRESITLLLLVLLGYELFYPRIFSTIREWRPLITVCLALLITILIKFIYTHYYPPIDTDKSSIRLVLFYIKEIVYDPFKLIRWFVGTLMAFGVTFLLSVVDIKKYEFRSPIYLPIILFSGIYIMLGLIAGGDSTRIVFLGYPFIMTFILLQLKHIPKTYVLLVLGLSIVQMRLFSFIPDPGKEFSQFASWYPEFARPQMVLAWLAYFIACFGLLLLIRKFFPKHTNS